MIAVEEPSFSQMIYSLVPLVAPLVHLSSAEGQLLFIFSYRAIINILFLKGSDSTYQSKHLSRICVLRSKKGLCKTTMIAITAH